jgi:aminocarboxymuconate-semialdehyde decarboxylase
MRVIDTHFHWFPRTHLERLCRQEGYPRAERNGDGYIYWYNEGRGRIDLPSVWLELEDGLAASEQATGAETAVIGTTGVLAGLLDQLKLDDAVDVAIGYNEAIAEAQELHPGRFYGTAAIPLADTNEAVRVLDHAVKELGLLGVNLPALFGNEPIDVARLEGFYDRVEELGVPLIVHPTDIAFGETLEGYDGAFQLTIGRLLDSSMTVLRLIFSGILERHPELKVIQTHGGALLPYQAGRFDKNAHIKGLPGKPSDYMHRVVVDTVCPQPLTIRTALEFYGESNVVYGTDYPCWSPAKAIATLNEAGVGDKVIESVLSTNAERLFNID